MDALDGIFASSIHDARLLQVAAVESLERNSYTLGRSLSRNVL